MVGFIGLGRMGLRISKRIAAKFKLSVYNRTKTKAEELRKLGVKICNTPKEVSAENNVIFLMLNDSKSVNDILFSPNGIVDGLKAGSYIYDLTTLHPAAAERFSESISNLKSIYIHAPVLGSINKAEEGTLSILIGADEKSVSKHINLIKTFSRRIFYLESAEKAACAKLIYNSFGGVTLALMALNFITAEKAEVQQSKIIEILQESAFYPVIEKYYRRMTSKDSRVFFELNQMAKDLQYANRSSYRFETPNPIVSAAESIYEIIQGEARKRDYTRLYEELRKLII